MMTTTARHRRTTVNVDALLDEARRRFPPSARVRVDGQTGWRMSPNPGDIVFHRSGFDAGLGAYMSPPGGGLTFVLLSRIELETSQ